MSENFTKMITDNNNLSELSRIVLGKKRGLNHYINLGAATFDQNVLPFDIYKTIRITPAGDGTIDCVVPQAGAVCILIIVSPAGINEYSFSANYKTAGMIASAAAKTHTITFVSDGTDLVEISRVESM